MSLDEKIEKSNRIVENINEVIKLLLNEEKEESEGSEESTQSTNSLFLDLS